MEAAEAIERGIKNSFNDAKTTLIPMADGGEGTMETLVRATNGKMKAVEVMGPLGETVTAHYGILGDESTCVIEMAEASGIDLIPRENLAPLTATTYGTGQLIKQALDDGFTTFILAIGGSATNDGGAGMLQAPGMQLLDKNHEEISFGGGELHRISRIEKEHFNKRIDSCTFLLASDVKNPLVGRWAWPRLLKRKISRLLSLRVRLEKGLRRSIHMELLVYIV